MTGLTKEKKMIRAGQQVYETLKAHNLTPLEAIAVLEMTKLTFCFTLMAISEKKKEEKSK